MKPEQQSLYNEQYLRTRLERILAETPRLSSRETWSLHRAQALLLTPPWMFSHLEKEEYKSELKHVSVFETKLVAEVEKRNLLNPRSWKEHEIFEQLLLVCSLARFHELFDSSLIESYLGAIQLAFIDGDTSPMIAEYVEELLWDIDWDEGAVQAILSDIQNCIELSEQNIDWSEGLETITARMQDLCTPHIKWNSWVQQAREDISLFFTKILEPKPVLAFAASSLSHLKPLPTLILWRREAEELSITHYQDNMFIQFYGTNAPQLYLGGTKLDRTLLPDELSSEKLYWWELPVDVQSSISMKFEVEEVTVSLL